LKFGLVKAQPDVSVPGCGTSKDEYGILLPGDRIKHRASVLARSTMLPGKTKVRSLSRFL
jgi:hypothetical protein